MKSIKAKVEPNTKLAKKKTKRSASDVPVVTVQGRASENKLPTVNPAFGITSDIEPGVLNPGSGATNKGEQLMVNPAFGIANQESGQTRRV